MTKIWKWIKNQFANHVVHIAVIWLIIGLLLLVGYWVSTSQGLDFQTLDWQVLTGFATWVLAGGIFLAFSQIRETRRSTQAQIAMDLFHELRDKKTMEQLRHVIYNLPYDYSKPKDEYQKGIIEYLISRFNVLGVLVEKQIIDEELAVEAYAGTTSLRCWYKLHKYIWEERDGKRKYFAEYFEDYTNRCCRYFKANNINVGFEKEGNTIDLVGELLKAKTETDKSKKRLYPRSIREIRRER